jgi:rod shape-determining protein MreC
MRDRSVRRRRAVLAGLVALSLVLLTAYFGEGAGGGLGSVQRGAMEVLAPVQEGATRALKPLRDLFGWFGDTLDAKRERDALRKENTRLERQVAQLQVDRRDAEQLRELEEINSAGKLGAYDPVQARVIARNPSVWDSTLTINRGSSDGVRPQQPVVNGDGLVGRVTEVSGGSAVVLLLTDKDFGATAETARSGEPGIVGSAVGAPGDLLFDMVGSASRVQKGEIIVTAGTQDERLRSFFPPDIPIGRVSRIEQGEGPLDTKVHVTPAADLRRLDFLEVLTKPRAELVAQVRP